MTDREELELILQLIKKHDLPLSPILEFAIKEKEEQSLLAEQAEDKVCETAPVYQAVKEVEDYEDDFANLPVGVSQGRKLPHKAVLLLAVMHLMETRKITENRIELDNVISNAFIQTWNEYFDGKVPTVWTPFYHLKSESFWHFKANGSEEKLTDILSFGGTPSVGKATNTLRFTARRNSLPTCA